MDKERYTFQEALGKRIRKLRKERNISQAKLGYSCGKDAQAIGRLERGEVNPGAYFLLQIAQALNISIKDLFDYNE